MSASDSVDIDLLRRSIQVAQRARANGNHPFGAVLADENGAVLLEAENSVLTDRDCSAHAELNLVRQACRQYDAATLARSTLYANAECCPMCAGAIFWSGIGRVVFGLSQVKLYEFVPGSPERLLLTPREVMARGGRAVEVVGPLLEDEARVVHKGFWT